MPITSKNPISLSGPQKRALRGQGHHLKPVVQIGRNGLSEGLIEASVQALMQHELIKISTSAEAPMDRKSAPRQLAEQTGSHLIQIIGRTALLYRRRFEDPEIELPGTIEEAPRPEGAA